MSVPSKQFALLCSVAALAVAAWPGAASAATTIYVSPSGSDTASGTSPFAPVQTLGQALKLARAGERVELAPGSYPLARDEAVRTGDVEVVGAGTDSTSVAGLQIYGGQRLSFRAIKFTAPVAVQGHPILHASQPASSISFFSDEFASSGSCVTIREGTRNITVADSYVHGCYTGIAGPGNPYMSTGIVIDGNTIATITSDGIQFGSWSHLRITDNLIRSIRDPAEVIHNDGIQFTGNSSDVTIARNVISDSRTQLIFIQDASGPIDDVTVENNLLYQAGAVALQSQGATHARFVNNTIWKAKDGGLWLRQGYPRNGTVVVPNDTLLSNNLATTIRYMEGAIPSATAGNVVVCPSKYSGITVPPGAACVADPQFVDVAAANYRLTDSSPARPLGSTLALPLTDLTGALRTAPVPGAYASQTEGLAAPYGGPAARMSKWSALPARVAG